MQQKQRTVRPDSFDHAAITPEMIDEAIRRGQRLRSEAIAAGFARLGHFIALTGGAIWHLASRRRSLPSSGGLKSLQRSCP